MRGGLTLRNQGRRGTGLDMQEGGIGPGVPTLDKRTMNLGGLVEGMGERAGAELPPPFWLPTRLAQQVMTTGWMGSANIRPSGGAR